MKYKCKSCGEYKDSSEFSAHYRLNWSICWTCKGTTAKSLYLNRAKEYRKNNRELVNDLSKRYHANLRSKFFSMYGNQCNCCGETTQEFLTLEHILGQRGIKKKDSSHRSYIVATREYRPDLYEVLCYNCNCAKGKLGYCPHQSYIHE